ncbi:hypothetical protein NBRC110019_25980 [Neptunitalea chrysea]|uniref:Outer membrane protein beta-barrel domain-containing protein n=1 Tax=Neptunitalea chrysea TaxID=1647581 RepID=A0A9W6EW92_9FLAO|nr:DUF6588 family protein [Neptunitalea chrysea]GLB53557.1 hypothetical protein NBRC110019_25980 [Neptunitalea chrysea]
MKKLIYLIAFISFSCLQAQTSYTSILAAGLEDSKAFMHGYLKPGTESLMYSINNGWFSTAEAKPFLGFEISFIGNVAVVDERKRTFTFNVTNLDGLTFSDGSTSNEVATVLGVVDPDVMMEYTFQDPVTGQTETIEIKLPESLTSEDVNMLPSGFLQASIGLLKGTELKVRVFPNIEINGNTVGLFGGGIQHEFTKWLPSDKLWPVAISGLVAYSQLDAEYAMEDVSVVDGDQQRIENLTKTWLFQGIVSTRLPVINFYAGFGYITGSSTSDLKGEYEVYDVDTGVVTSVKDPLSITHDISGVRTTLGTRLKLGFFRLNADYTFAEYNTTSVGVSFGFR